MARFRGFSSDPQQAKTLKQHLADINEAFQTPLCMDDFIYLFNRKDSIMKLTTGGLTGQQAFQAIFGGKDVDKKIMSLLSRRLKSHETIGINVPLEFQNQSNSYSLRGHLKGPEDF